MISGLVLCLLTFAQLLFANELADDIRSCIDFSVNPCVDFYDFACGAWINNTKLPPTLPILEKGITMLLLRNQNVSKDIVEDKSTGLLNVFYESCLDMATIDSRGLAPLATDLGLAQTLAPLFAPGLFARGIQPYFSLSSVIDAENPDYMILQFDQGGLGLPDFTLYLADDSNSLKIRQEYVQHITNMLTLTNYTGNAAADAQAILQFETLIANFTISPDELSNPFTVYNNFKFLDFVNQVTPAVRITDWFNFFKPLGLRPAMIAHVLVTVPSFMTNVTSLVQSYMQNQPGVLQAYQIWNAVNARATLLTTPIRAEHFRFYNTILNGQQTPQELWRQCISQSDASVGDLLGKFFIDKAFPGASKTIALNLLQGIMAAMKFDIQSITWMDSKTQQRALEKLSKVSHLIGGPTNPSNYSNVNITATTYFENVVNCVVASVSERLAGVGGKRNPEEWDMTASTVNAYYDPTRNQMVFPAAFLQPPFFNYTLTPELEPIQIVMGHELTHGFDDQGRLYNGDGKLEDWWENVTAQKFLKKVQCIIDQYSQFEVIPGVFVNGKLTQGENIADCGGTKNAFNSMASQLGRSVMEPSILSGFNRGQLFFIYFAQTWCAKATDQHYRLSVKTDVHSPPKFRVNGPFMNLPAFAQFFHCPVGSPMNPADKCEVW